MPSNGSRIDTIERGNELIGTRRELALRDIGMVVTHRITGRSQSPVQFQLFDPLPGGFDIDDIGFHPDYPPAHGRVDHETAVISGVVEPEQVLEIKYGIRPSHPEPPEEVQRIQSNRRQSIELSAIVGPNEAISEALEQAAATRSSSQQNATEESSDLSERTHGLWGDEEEPEAAESSRAESPAKAERKPDADSERSTTDEHWIKTLFLEDDEDRDASGEDEPSDRSDEAGLGHEFWGIGGDPFGDSQANGVLSSGISRGMSRSGDLPWKRWALEDAKRAEEEYRKFDAIFSRIDEEAAEPPTETEARDADERPLEKREEVGRRVDPSDAPEEFVVALLEQLEAGAVSEDQRRRLAGQLAECGVSVPSSSAEQRLRALESDMAKLGSSIDTLEAIIDEHGPADQYLGEVRGEISELEASTRELDAALRTAADDREWIGEQLDEIENLTDELRTRFERLEGQVDSFRTVQQSTFAELEGPLAEVVPVVDQVDRMEAELERLENTVETTERVKRAILRALSDEGA